MQRQLAAHRQMEAKKQFLISSPSVLHCTPAHVFNSGIEFGLRMAPDTVIPMIAEQY